MILRRTVRIRLLAAALFAGGATFGVAQSDASGARNAKAAADARAAAKERGTKGAGGQNLQELLRQWRESRDTMIADHQALAKRLKDATEEEKKAIKERMEAQMKAFQEQQAALHKQIRDEQRRQRQNSGKR